MQCISTPLSEDKLLAVMSDVAEDAVLDHLRECVFCQTRLIQLEQAEAKLRQKLYRWDCPDANTLGEFALDMLLEAERDRIAEHVKSCVSCQSDLAELRLFMDAIDRDEAHERDMISQHQGRPASTPTSVRRPSRIPGLVMQRAVFQGAALRGDGPQTFELEGLRLMVSATQEQGYYELSGQLLGADVSRWRNGLVKAEQNEGRSTLGIINERNKFQCRLQAGGDVRLTISAQDGTVITVEGIKLSPG